MKGNRRGEEGKLLGRETVSLQILINKAFLEISLSETCFKKVK
jgi:hypothetical protein